MPTTIWVWPTSPELIKAAQEGLDKFGFGVASVRFICGTQDIHKALEDKISNFLGMEDTILYSSCFDANAGLFETLLTAEDAIISDSPQPRFHYRRCSFV